MQFLGQIIRVGIGIRESTPVQTNGRIAIDSNDLENAFSPPAMGKRN